MLNFFARCGACGAPAAMGPRWLCWVLLLLGRLAEAQDMPSRQPFMAPVLPNYGFPCWADSLEQAARPFAANQPSSNFTSYHGGVFTPRGELRVLVIYAGISDDNQLDQQGIPVPILGNNEDPDNLWPQRDTSRNRNLAWGEALPRNAYDKQIYYTRASDFDTLATDKTLSNYYYQMSRRSPRGPLKMVFRHLPRRVNVPFISTKGISGLKYDSATQRYVGKVDLSAYSRDVIRKVVADYDGAPYTMRWDSLDQRRNTPIYQRDNSGYQPDRLLDFIIIVWRLTGNTYQYTYNGKPAFVTQSGAGGALHNFHLAENNFRRMPPVMLPGDTTRRYWSWGYEQTMGMSGLDFGLALHELAHAMYNSPHYFGANGTFGQYFHGTSGWGMMGGAVAPIANAWERWYNGWIDIETSGVKTDIGSPADLNNLPTTGRGTYTLRDYATTGDVLRIRLPMADSARDPITGRLLPPQYLWLENHQGGNVFDNHPWEFDGNGKRMPASARGLFAMVDDMGATRNRGIMNNGTNGFKVLASHIAKRSNDSAAIVVRRWPGNNDYTVNRPPSPFWIPANPDPNGGYLWGNHTYNLTRPIANPLSGQCELSNFRVDRYDWISSSRMPEVDTRDTIRYHPCSGNQDCEGTQRNEYIWVAVVDSSRMGGLQGPDIGFNEVGDKLGMMTNPAITPHQRYSASTTAMSAMPVHGLSVEIIGKDTVTGALTVRVRFDDVDVPVPATGIKELRWTGEIALYDNPHVTNSLHVPATATLVLDQSGTPNRHTKHPVTQDFVNPTVMTCYAGSELHVAGKLVVKNGSKLVIKRDARVLLQPGAELSVESKGEVVVEDGATLVVQDGARVTITGTASQPQAAFRGRRSRLTLQNTDPDKGLLLLPDALVEVGQDGEIQVTPGAHLDLGARHTVGGNGYPGSGLKLWHTASHLLLDDATLAVPPAVDFTFEGNGQVTFDGTRAKLELDPTSAWRQSGPSRNDVLYELLDGASLRVEAYAFELNTGRIRYSGGSRLEVVSTKAVSLNNMEFSGSAASLGGLALDCTAPEFAATACVVRYQYDGMRLTVDQGTTLTGCTVSDIVLTGWEFTQAGPVIISGGAVERCRSRGITSQASELYLRDGVRIANNGVGVYSDTDGSWLVAGDVGCAWIINNEVAGVRGRNIRLDIDALAHQSSSNSSTPQINRFDGNAKLFDICYDAALQLQDVSAEGNYWGSSGPVFGTDYVLSLAPHCNVPHYKINANQALACEPTSCAGCGSPGRPAAASTPSALAPLALELAPNPAQTTVRLTVAEAGDYQYRIVTAQGQTLASGAFTGGSATVPTTGWPRGVYRVVLWRVGTPAKAAQTLVVE